MVASQQNTRNFGGRQQYVAPQPQTMAVYDSFGGLTGYGVTKEGRRFSDKKLEATRMIAEIQGATSVEHATVRSRNGLESILRLHCKNGWVVDMHASANAKLLALVVRGEIISREAAPMPTDDFLDSLAAQDATPAAVAALGAPVDPGETPEALAAESGDDTLPY